MNRQGYLGGSDAAAILGIRDISYFRVIEDAPNYLIYEDGRVYSKLSNKFLKHQITIHGYAHVKLGADNWRSIHRLVAESFISNPESKPYVNHIDGNKLNNHFSNLEWVTHKENCAHAIKTGLVAYKPWSHERKKALSEKMKGNKLSVETKKRISNAKKGKKLKPFTEDHKRNIANSLKKFHSRVMK